MVAICGIDFKEGEMQNDNLEGYSHICGRYVYERSGEGY